MRQIRPDLWETEPEYPMPGLSTHAYLWTPATGDNVLFYNTTHAHELDHMAELGGLAHQYLSHQDEVAGSLRTIRERFGARLHTHRSEADIAAAQAPVDAPFDERHVGVHGIEVIPGPGHTPGSTFYLVPSAHGETYLFTGDSVLRGHDGTWVAGYIPGVSDRDALARSLADIAELTPDLVISSAFMGDGGVTEIRGADWSASVAEALRSLATT